MTSSLHVGPAGAAVLVVEDSGLIVAKVVQLLRRARCRVVGPVATVEEALALVRSEGDTLHAAALDVDLRGERVFPVAELLHERKVPFLFLTGYTALGIPEAWQHVPRIVKPFTASALLAAVADLVAGRPPQAGAGTGLDSAETTEFDQRIADVVRRSRDLIMERRIISETINSEREADGKE